MDKTKKWRKILAMMLTVVMMLQNAQSVMVFADVTNEQIEQRLAGGRTQTEQTQPDQSQVETRANGEEYKTQPQETTTNDGANTEFGSSEGANATTEAKTSNADVSATITQSVFQQDISGATYNFVQMTAQITNNDTENAATGVSVKSLLNSAQLSYVNGYGTETSGAGAWAVDSNNTSDLPSGSADGYDQIIMWTDQTIGAGETVAYQYTAQLIPETLDGVADAWYVDGTSCSYTWENTEVLTPAQTPEATPEEPDATPEVTPETTPEVTPDETPETTPEITPETTPEATPEVTETPEETPTPEVTEAPEETPTPEPTQAADDKEAKAAKKKQQQKLLAQRNMADETDMQDGEDNSNQVVVGNENENASHEKSKDIANSHNKLTFTYYVKHWVENSDGTKQLVSVPYQEGQIIPRDYDVDIKLTYEFDDINKPTANAEENGGYFYKLPDLPEGFTLTTQTSGSVVTPDGKTIGSYRIDTDKKIVNFDYSAGASYFQVNSDNIKGTFWLRTSLDKDAIADKGQVTFTVDNTTIKYEDTKLNGKKSYIVNADGLLEFSIVLTAGDTANATNVVVTDTLTGKLEFVDGSFTAKDSKNQEVGITVTGTGKQREITLINSIPKGETVTIKYLVNPNLDSTSDEPDSNTAKWEWGNGTGNDKSSDSDSTGNIDLNGQVLNKYSTIDQQNNEINYTIQINPFEKQILPDGTTGQLTLKDVLQIYDPATGKYTKYDPTKLSFERDSVKVIDKNKKDLLGSKEAEFGFSETDGTLTLKIPDKTAITLEYKVKVLGDIGDTVTVKNTATLTGNYQSGTTTAARVEEAGATLEGDATKISFRKVSEYGTNSPLKGVHFKLYAYNMDPEKNPEENPECVDEAVSDDNGNVTFGATDKYKLSANTLYHFEEAEKDIYTVNGKKYIPNTEKRYFMIYRASTLKDDRAKLKKDIEKLYGKDIAQKTVLYLAGTNLPEFTNKEVPSSIDLPVKATKTLDGKTILDDNTTFDFNLMLKTYTPDGDWTTDAYQANDNLQLASVSKNTDPVLALSKNEDGSITGYNQSVTSVKSNIVFSDIRFEYEGIYTFVMQEIAKSDNKYVYDGNKKEITVKVTRGEDTLTGGNLIVKEVTPDISNSQNIVFNNLTTKTLTLKKETTSAVLSKTEFTFELNGKWDNNEPFNFANVKVDGKAIAYDNGVAKVSIPVERFTSEGEVKLTGIPLNVTVEITETNLPDGWIYVPESSTKSVKMDSDKEVVVTNKYSENGTVTFKVAKTFNDWNSNSSFEFKIESANEAAKNKLPANPSVYINGGNKTSETRYAQFGTIEFTDDGEYIYKISEVIPENTEGITYDNSETYIKVLVGQGSGGKKKITVYTAKSKGELENAEGQSLNVVEAKFENRIATTGVTFKATKALLNQTIGDKKFTFKVKDITENGSGKEISAQNDSEGNIVFPEISYKSTDLGNETQKEYVYQIYEDCSGITPTLDGKYVSNGITYDNTTRYEVKIVVKKEGGTLKILCGNKDITGKIYNIPVNDSDGRTTNFVNKYEAETTVQFKGTKELVNKELKAGDYTFTIEAQDSADQRFTTDTNERTSIKNVTNEAPAAGNSNIGEIVFPTMKYTIADLDGVTAKNGVRTKDFNYTISETKPQNQIPGITYDETKIKVTVRLTDDGKGNLSTQVLYNGTGDFKNPDNGVYTLPTPQNKNATFTNTYDSSTEIQIKGTKALVNQELKENQFKFKIESVDQPKDNRFAGNKTEEIQTNKTPGENNVGEFEFGVMKYTAADLNDVQANENGVREKSFHYIISEVDGGLTKDDGIKYDGRMIWVTVKLTDDGKSNLKAELSIKNSAEGNADELTGSENNGVMVYTLPALTDKPATFTNIFVKKSLELKALKKLVGRNFKDGDEFMFIVTKDGHQFDSKTITPTSGNEVEFTFKADEYTLADVGKTYHYSIREDHGNKITGVTNSNRVYEVFVTPTYDGANGTILFQKVEKITEKDDSGKEVEKDINFETAEFTNVYEADGTAQIVAEKNLSPLKISDGEFSFTLTQVNEDGTELTGGYTQKNITNVGSSVIFKPISYTAADIGKTYYYTVKEDKPDEIPKGYEYSNDVYRVAITIGEAEGKDNKLTVTKQITKEGSEDPVDTIVFYNTYKATGSIELTGEKEVKDFTGELEDGAFNFIVTENGEKVATGKNDKDGKITFDKIQYVYDGSNSNVLGKHTYTISEVQPKTGDGYIYDKTTRKVVVEVKDKGDGTLDASIVTGKDETTEEDISDVDIDAENNIVVKKFVNEEMGISFRKTDIADKEIEGATLTLYEYKDGKKGTEVTHWETKKDETHVVTSGLVAGNSYILEETKVPDGYVKADPIVFKINNDAERSVEIVSGGQKDKNGNIVMVDKKTGVQILKVNEDGKPLAGASLAIKDSTGNIIDQWVSTDAAHTIEGKLVEGAEYVLTEIKAPEGYKMASDVTFKANASDKPTVVTMKDDYTEVSIQKTDYNGKALSGATLELKDSTGKVIDTWKTDGTAHVLKGKLVEGAEYTLTETSAPSGYRVSLDIKFKVSKNEKVTTVTMKDAPTKASILKTDESGKALSGAQLVVKDSTGKEIDKWTTDGKAHEITGLLTVGETYTLSEVSAPSGYTVAPDQTFKMEDKDVIEVTMVDYPASGSGQITVTKKITLANGGENVDLIAQDDTFYVNLFTDAAGKYPYKGSAPKAIHLVNASAGSVTFDDLAQGTYYVYETDELGNVINLDQQAMRNGTQFMCTVNGGSNTVKLDLKSGPKEGAVNLENVFYDIPNGYSYKGEINISKQVLKGNSQTTVEDTFYAGIFTKDSDGVYNLFEVVPLEQNGTVTVEVPLGGEDGTEPINYYILETDADGNILDLDVFEYEVSGEGTVALNKDNLTGNIGLVNKIPEDTDGKLRVQKTDGNGVGLAGASFRLTDEDGNVVDEWTSEASAHELELEPGTYTLTEVQAPSGYTGAGSVTIVVDDDYNFSVSGEIEYSYGNGLLKIVNKVVPSTPSSGTPVSGGTTPNSYSSALSGKVAVKTGDNTPIGAYAAILVIAALAIAGGVVYKKKKKKDDR